ncbi:WD40 repeat-like protein [Neoconidiobolus thromboides FSU 785]|nr:WD40 repeat-like protein [Neoconidiobolus thromboides FSU 785]
MEKEDNNSHLGAIWSLASTSNNIITGSIDKTVKLWKIEEDLKVERTLHSEHLWGVTSVDITNNDKYVCSIGLDNKLVIYDMQVESIVHKIEFKELTTYKCKISPDSTQVAICGQKGKISIYSIQDGKPLFDLKAPTDDFLLSITYSPCGNYIGCGSNQGNLYLMSIQTQSLYRKFNVSQSSIRAVSFSEDGQCLAVGTDEGKITVYNPHHQNILGVLTGHESWINSLLIQKDDVAGNLLISGSSDTTVKFWCLDNITCIGSIRSNLDEDTSLKDQVWGVIRKAVSEQDYKIVIALESGSLNLLDQPIFQLK